MKTSVSDLSMNVFLLMYVATEWGFSFVFGFGVFFVYVAVNIVTWLLLAYNTALLSAVPLAECVAFFVMSALRDRLYDISLDHDRIVYTLCVYLLVVFCVFVRSQSRIKGEFMYCMLIHINVASNYNLVFSFSLVYFNISIDKCIIAVCDNNNNINNAEHCHRLHFISYSRLSCFLNILWLWIIFFLPLAQWSLVLSCQFLSCVVGGRFTLLIAFIKITFTNNTLKVSLMIVCVDMTPVVVILSYLHIIFVSDIVIYVALISLYSYALFHIAFCFCFGLNMYHVRSYFYPTGFMGPLLRRCFFWSCFWDNNFANG